MGPPDNHPPPSSGTTATGTTTRAYATFTPTWQRFNNPPKPPPPANAENKTNPNPAANNNGTDYGNGGAGVDSNPYLRQYSHVYSRRLTQLRDRCLESAKTDGVVGHSSRSSATPTPPAVIPRIIELPESKLATVVGTVVKSMPSRPPIDTSYNSGSAGATYLGTTDATDLYLDPIGTTYCSPSASGEKGDDRGGAKGGDKKRDEKRDTLVLEDESGRVEIVPDPANPAAGRFNLNVDSLATGVVVAVTGTVTEGTGVMVVRSVHFPCPPKSADDDDDDEEETVLRGPTSAAARMEGTNEQGGDSPGSSGSPYVMLISGLGCGSPSTGGAGGGSLALRRDLVSDYLAGHTDPNHDGAKVCRVIVAGGGCAMPRAGSSSNNNDKKSSSSDVSSMLDDPSLPIKELDLYLSELCASGLPVDYVPGHHDPTNAAWPQKPLHPCLLPNATTFPDLMFRSTNPYEAKVGGRVVLGTDGRNLRDLGRYVVASADATAADAAKDEDEDTKMDDVDAETEEVKAEAKGENTLSPIDVLQSTLVYSHMAPTGPDSLPTYPSYECDPFVIDTRPDVYFAGNCDEFETRLLVGDGGVGAEGEGKGGGRTTRLICVPSFQRTGQAVLLNLESLDCEVMTFDDDVVG